MKYLIKTGIRIAGLALLCFVVSGCGPKLPSDLPKLYPVELTLLQEGKPVANAMVSLKAEQSQTHYGAGGVSNDSGIVTIRTHGKYPGAPEGKYTVSVMKEETVKSGPWDQMPTDNSEARVYMEKHKKELKSDTFQLIEKKYTSSKTSDLKIEVTANGCKQTLELGKPVKIKIEGTVL